ncbi:MAG: ATP-dependent DNA helicase [Litorivicinus sp.]
MSPHLSQLHDTLTRHFNAQVAEQALPLAGAWLGGSTAIPRSELGEIQAALDAGCLVQSHGFVYLARGYAQEQALAQALAVRAQPRALSEQQNQALDQLAHAAPFELNTQQRAAIDLAVTGDFGLLLGGPGTGKSTVIQLMAQAYLQLENPRGEIGLAAPTGKAASRLNGLIPNTQPMTLARMERELRQGRVLDLLIVDEASMIDLENARRLLGLLPPTTRLVWIGDPQQLDSVEPGSILAELARCTRLAPRRRTLTQTYRFSADTPLGRLAQGIKQGDAAAAQRQLDGLACSPGTLLEEAIEHYATLHHPDPATHLAALEDYQLLCATRVGYWGSEQVNERIAQALTRRGLIPAEPGDGWVVMVTRNQPTLGLANGDVGVIHNDHLICDAGPIPLHLIQQYQTAWAISVHKSQGSEYRRVGLMLGEDGESVGLSRALLYTGVTRAKATVRLGCTPQAVLQALHRVPKRTSGLAEQIDQA